jgi:SAM-dependent methyltransferase
MSRVSSIKLAPFNPTCQQAQEIALELLQLSPTDVLFDLGCGDGRFLIHAASSVPNLKCVGIELDHVYVERARRSVSDHGLQEFIEIRDGDALDPAVYDAADGLRLSNSCSALFLYLLPKGLDRIKPLLDSFRDNNRPLRIVSYIFAIPGLEATAVNRQTRGECAVYLYSI